MNPQYIYPGTFCPPQYGHVAIAKEAAKTFGNLTIICSVNPIKETSDLLTPAECKEMWLTYDLDPKIKVTTLDEFLKNRDESIPLIIVRGIRDDNDIKYEDNVILYNCKHFGVTHYHYIICKEEFQEMSSTKARLAAKLNDKKNLNLLVNPLVAAKMLEKYRR